MENVIEKYKYNYFIVRYYYYYLYIEKISILQETPFL